MAKKVKGVTVTNSVIASLARAWIATTGITEMEIKWRWAQATTKNETTRKVTTRSLVIPFPPGASSCLDDFPIPFIYVPSSQGHF